MESSDFLQNASYMYPDSCLDTRNPRVTEKRHFGTETTVLVSGHAGTSNLALWVDRCVVSLKIWFGGGLQ